MAVGLSSAAATIQRPLVPMSMHTSFLAFGSWGSMQADVEAVHDGRSFANRRVVLAQQDRTIAAVDVAFHSAEEGPERQHRNAPDAPPAEILGRFETVTGGLDLMELRPVRPVAAGPVPDGRLHPYWARVHEELGPSPQVNAAALAFLSDYFVIFSPFEPGSGEGRTWRNYTLEHSIWFHGFTRAGQWHLFDAEPLIRSGGRYVTRGTVHDERGRLVASFVQEGLSRPIPPGPRA